MKMWRAIFLSLIVFPISLLGATDCRSVAPFTPFEEQSVKVSVGRFFWTTVDGEAVQNFEDVCARTGTISAYDVRGREADAYYCLKPAAQEVFSCATTLNGRAAEVAVLPATWIRTWTPSDVREYRFHAYVMDLADSQNYLDVFSRTLSTRLTKDDVITEGAIKNGPGEARDGYFIRLEFVK